VFYLLSKYFGSLKIHASTQLTTHNEGQIKFLGELNATRVNLSRELNINEIKALTTTAHKINVLTEIFVARLLADRLKLQERNIKPSSSRKDSN